MASLVVSGDTSGAVTISAPAVAGTTTVTLPSSTGTMALLQTPSFATTIGVGGTTASASGAGISFPATQSASSDANTLDDYEEGTVTVTDASGAGLTFSSNTGYYTKVGRLVTFSIDIVYPTTSNTAQAAISLPFTAVTSGRGGGGAISYTTVSGGVTAYLGTTSAMTIYALGTGAVITNSQLSGKELGVVFTYHANS